MTPKEERDRFLVWCGARGVTCPDARALMQLASRLQKMAERECSDPSWERDPANEKRQDRAGERAIALVKACFTGYFATVSGDPRGAVVQLWSNGQNTDSETCVMGVPAEGYAGAQLERMTRNRA